MFPMSYSFYSTGLFKELCEIWHIFYMYPFDAIAIKNGRKMHIAFLHVNIAKQVAQRATIAHLTASHQNILNILE